MSERLELVKSFEELRAGLIIVIKGCHYCGKNHRTMCVRREDTETIDPRGVIEFERAWLVLPGPSHDGRDPSGGWAVTPLTIAAGLVFRVVDEDLTETSQPVARKLERVR